MYPSLPQIMPGTVVCTCHASTCWVEADRIEGHPWLLSNSELEILFLSRKIKAEAGVMMNNRHCLKYGKWWNHARKPKCVIHAYAVSRTRESTKTESRGVGAKCKCRISSWRYEMSWLYTLWIHWKHELYTWRGKVLYLNYAVLVCFSM